MFLGHHCRGVSLLPIPVNQVLSGHHSHGVSLFPNQWMSSISLYHLISFHFFNCSIHFVFVLINIIVAFVTPFDFNIIYFNQIISNFISHFQSKFTLNCIKLLHQHPFSPIVLLVFIIYSFLFLLIISQYVYIHVGIISFAQQLHLFSQLSIY